MARACGDGRMPIRREIASSSKEYPYVALAQHVRKRGSEATPPSGGDAPRSLRSRGALVTWRSGGNASLPCCKGIGGGAPGSLRVSGSELAPIAKAYTL